MLLSFKDGTKINSLRMQVLKTGVMLVGGGGKKVTRNKEIQMSLILWLTG